MKHLCLLIMLITAISFVKCNLNQNNFSSDFMFGVGSSAFQIEGAWNLSGKGESIWDYWTHTRHAFVLDLYTANISSDAYHHVEEDIALLEYLGVDFYRFSISWPRILPFGTINNVNNEGLEYYGRVLKELRSKGIKAMVVLFNWDIPKELHFMGGWANKITINFFIDYAKLVIDTFGEVVDFWITFHDPYSICTQGDWTSGFEDYDCMHNILKAHAQLYHYYKEQTSFLGQMSINIDAPWFEPKIVSQSGLEGNERILQFMIGWTANPIFSETGDYPQVMKDRIVQKSQSLGLSKSRLPEFSSEEIEYIKGTADFFAISHFTTYATELFLSGRYDVPSFMDDAGVLVVDKDDVPKGASDWLRVFPDGFRKVLNWIHSTYNSSSIVVTGNGYSDNGEVEDGARVDYHFTYLSALLETIVEDGINVIGYGAWSFMDSFEWREGYSHKFGLISVDFSDENRTRTTKNSAEVYKHIVHAKKLNYTLTSGSKVCSFKSNKHSP